MDPNRKSNCNRSYLHKSINEKAVKINQALGR